MGIEKLKVGLEFDFNAVVSIYLPKGKFQLLIKSFKKYSLMSIFGGAISNFFDRIYYSAVPDFIDIHINNFHWFIFNVADIFITVGVICLIYAEIFDNKREKRQHE